MFTFGLTVSHHHKLINPSAICIVYDRRNAFQIFYLFEIFIEFRMWKRHLFTLKHRKKNERKIDNRKHNHWPIHSPFSTTYLSLPRCLNIFDMSQLANTRMIPISFSPQRRLCFQYLFKYLISVQIATKLNRILFYFFPFRNFTHTIFKRPRIIPTYLLNGRLYL